MTRFEKFKNMNIDEMVEELYKHSDKEMPWDEWFDKKYCLDCPAITKKVQSILSEDHMVDREYSYCELNECCRYFPELTEYDKSEKRIIKMWLEEKEEPQQVEEEGSQQVEKEVE